VRGRSLLSVAVTAILWTYFIGTFLLGYWVVFLVAGVLRRRRGIAWALATYQRGFFFLLRTTIPGLRFEVPTKGELRSLRGTVIVCNHISFLDPILLMSLFPDVISIVRPDFFRVPIFGWLLRGAGFLGPDLFAEGQVWIARVEHHLRTGGNLLVFPEGTRSRDGQLAPFKKGAFFLARHLAAPIVVMRITGTNTIFGPGRLSFNVSRGQCIRVERLSVIAADQSANETTYELCKRVRDFFVEPASSRISACPLGTRSPC